jgi:hypothetical protein
MATSRNVGSSPLSKDEFANQIEDFKSDMRQFLAMQLDTLRIQKKQEEAKRDLVIFCPRCLKKHPRNECPMHSLEVCFVCEEYHPTDQCPSLPRIKAAYQRAKGATESLYYMNQRRPHGPRSYQQEMQGIPETYYDPYQAIFMPSWDPPAHPSWSTPPPWSYSPCSFTDPYYAQPVAHSFHPYAQPQPQWNAPYQEWRPQYHSHPTHFPPPPAHPQPSPPPPPRQPQMPTQPQCHPSPSQTHTSTHLPVPFPKPCNGAAQPNCKSEAQHVKMIPRELNDVHQSSGKALKKRDHFESIEGSHPAKEDSKEETKEPWAALDEEKRSKSEIERDPSWLPSNLPCTQEEGQQKEEDQKVMIEGDMKNDPNQQDDQGYQSYIEIWFHKVTKLQQYFLPQFCLIPSTPDHFVFEIWMPIKACISSLQIIFSLISMCTWLHWKYSYT